jgi:hypothetical protein
VIGKAWVRGTPKSLLGSICSPVVRHALTAVRKLWKKEKAGLLSGVVTQF